MTALEELVAAVNDSTRLDAGTKAILIDFLDAAGPAAASLGPEALREFMVGLAGGALAPSALVDSLTQEQVVALLGQTESAMAGMLEGRAAQVAAARAAMQNLANAALGILARILVAAL